MPCAGVSELIGKHTTKGLPEYPGGGGKGDFQPSGARVWRLGAGVYPLGIVAVPILKAVF